MGQRFAEPTGEPVAIDSLPDDWYQTLHMQVQATRQGAEAPEVVLSHQLRVANVVTEPLLAFLDRDVLAQHASLAAT